MASVPASPAADAISAAMSTIIAAEVAGDVVAVPGALDRLRDAWSALYDARQMIRLHGRAA